MRRAGKDGRQTSLALGLALVAVRVQVRDLARLHVSGSPPGEACCRSSSRNASVRAGNRLRRGRWG